MIRLTPAAALEWTRLDGSRGDRAGGARRLRQAPEDTRQCLHMGLGRRARHRHRCAGRRTHRSSAARRDPHPEPISSRWRPPWHPRSPEAASTRDGQGRCSGVSATTGWGSGGSSSSRSSSSPPAWDSPGRARERVAIRRGPTALRTDLPGVPASPDTFAIGAARRAGNRFSPYYSSKYNINRNTSSWTKPLPSAPGPGRSTSTARHRSPSGETRASTGGTTTTRPASHLPMPPGGICASTVC